MRCLCASRSYPQTGTRRKPLQSFIERFREPSSWAAVTGMLAMFVTMMPEGFWTSLNAALAGVTALIGVFLKEKGDAK
jgi:hypothetical protein